jgi:hypothetical protein
MMTDLANIFDFMRVAGVLLLMYFVLPLAARRMGDSRTGPWYRDIVPSFLHAGLFFAVTTVILGNWRLCFAGFMAFLVVCWLGVTIAFASRRRWIWEAGEWRIRFLRLLEWVEAVTSRNRFGRASPVPEEQQWTQALVLLGILAGCALVERTWFAVENYRFLASLTYQRALSLQTLVHGGPWQPDGSVVLLAPLSHFSGADGATVLRFAGPLFALLLAPAGGYCAWVYSRRFSAAYLAAGLLTLYPSQFGFDSHGEVAGPEMACVFWILSIAMLRESWKYGAGAAALALMVHREFTPVLAASLLTILLALLLARTARLFPRFLKTPARAGAAAMFAILLMRPLTLPAGSDGPLQYESAARVVARIAREFPRNRWIIVSPAQEVSTTYGRGWHIDLSEFVREYSPRQLARAEFRFPYSVNDVFVFVEKEPLRQTAQGAAMAADEYSYEYYTQVGRTTLEFQAGRLMAAYSATHSDASVYYQDEHVVIYRVDRAGH